MVADRPTRIKNSERKVESGAIPPVISTIRSINKRRTKWQRKLTPKLKP